MSQNPFYNHDSNIIIEDMIFYIIKNKKKTIPFRIRPLLTIMAITDFDLKELSYLLNVKESQLQKWLKEEKIHDQSFERVFRVAYILQYLDIGNSEAVKNFLLYHKAGRKIMWMIRDCINERTNEILAYMHDKKIPRKIASLAKLFENIKTA